MCRAEDAVLVLMGNPYLVADPALKGTSTGGLTSMGLARTRRLAPPFRVGISLRYLVTAQLACFMVLPSSDAIRLAHSAALLPCIHMRNEQRTGLWRDTRLKGCRASIEPCSAIQESTVTCASHNLAVSCLAPGNRLQANRVTCNIIHPGCMSSSSEWFAGWRSGSTGCCVASAQDQPRANGGLDRAAQMATDCSGPQGQADAVRRSTSQHLQLVPASSRP